MEIKTAKQAFDFLPGLWRLTRNVKSQLLSEKITASGYGMFVVFKDDPNLILYSEKVNLYNVNLNIHASCTQKYKYKYDVSKASICKYFSDDRFFYELRVVDNKANGGYLCVRDKYIPNYVFSENRFSLTYAVNGPSKSYEIVTDYKKYAQKMLIF